MIRFVSTRFGFVSFESSRRRRRLRLTFRGLSSLVSMNSTKAEMKQVAEKEEQLVPIRLEIDYDPFKFRDTFTWNASGESPSSTFLVKINIPLQSS